MIEPMIEAALARGQPNSSPEVPAEVSSGRPAAGGATRVFLLSPANAAGFRGGLLLNESARFDLAARFHRQGLSLGELFSFISGLYFRGKMAYAQAYAQVPHGITGAYVITACWGLLPLDHVISPADLREMLQVPIEPADPRYRIPLDREARSIADAAGVAGEVVLLGSIATPKYVEPLLPILGERLLFPAEFVGRGDMSRGGLMLRHVRAGTELRYIPVATAVRRGSRPTKLTKLLRQGSEG